VKKIFLLLIFSSGIYAALCQSTPIQLYKEGYYILMVARYFPLKSARQGGNETNSRNREFGF
jgi:hypothetical protein